jgi:signal transduction histidine kinase
VDTRNSDDSERQLHEPSEETENTAVDELAELRAANQRLRAEIAERERAEAELAAERNRLTERVRERTEELARSSAELARTARMKDEFLANMSHELRTPLNAILGMSEVLLEQTFGPLGDKQLRAVASISKAGRRLLGLINDVLDVAGIDAGTLQPYPGPVHVNALCTSCLGLVKQRAVKKKLEVSLDLEQTAEAVLADERQLKQILVNLLTNAVSFTPEGGRVGLKVSDVEERVRFEVWDTGVGIEPDQLQRIFGPFVQIEGGSTRTHDGAGLGLALVRRLVDLNHGQLEVESEPGQGSRFAVVRPAHLAEVEPEPVTEEPDAGQRARPEISGQGERLLLVEDNEDTIETLTAYLQSVGFVVAAARDGAQALEEVADTLPDLMILDMHLPEVDGFEVARRLRADARTADLPILALTALAMPGDKERCLEAGADMYLSKPVNLRRLVEVILSLLP